MISNTDIIVIMDESGSMGSMGVEPIQAINCFIKEQQQAIVNTDSLFTLWKFDTTVKNVIDDVCLKDIKEFTDYTPKGMTALYDAIGNAIMTKKTKTNVDNVICVIITDGIENSSLKFTSADIMGMIKTMENDHNWKFIYLGANQDAIAVGGNMGMNTQLCSSFESTPGGLLTATRNISNSISLYRTQSITMSLSNNVSPNSPNSQRAQRVPNIQRDQRVPSPPSISPTKKIKTLHNTMTFEAISIDPIPFRRNLRVNIDVAS